MSNDLNRCEFIGRLGKDPESRTMPNGNEVVNFSIACNEDWKDKNTGQKQEKTTWVSIVVFGKLAGICSQYLAQGSKVFIAGKLQVRKWQDQSGNDRYTTEIVANEMQMLDSRGGAASSGGQSGEYGQGAGVTPNVAGHANHPPPGDFEDDIPF